MTTTFISTDIITTNTVGFSFGNNADQMVLAPNVFLASSAASALVSFSFDNLTTSIFGTMLSSGVVSFNGDNNVFQVASGGNMISTRSAPNEFALGETLGTNSPNTFIIDGTLTSLQSIAIHTAGASKTVVTGEVNAGTVGVLMGSGATAGDALYNSGQIIGGLLDVAGSFNGRLIAAVSVDGNNSRVINQQGGVIENVAATGFASGLYYEGDISGARLRNFGEITSVDGVGISMSSVTGANNLSLINHGTVQGQIASLLGASFDAMGFTNRGEMVGDVIFGILGDTFDNRNGTVDGNVQMADGNDFYNGRLDGLVLGEVLGDFGDDTLYGGDNDDVMSGGEDNDQLRGFDGDDELNGDNGIDLLMGYDGDDVLLGGNGNDRLIGGRGNDVLNGGNDADRLNGDDGDDVLIGGRGNDIMFGGAGADTFTFLSTLDTGLTGATRDRIFDFDEAEGDIIFLASIDADVTAAGNQVFSYIGGAAFSNTAGELRYGSNGMIEGDVDGDGADDFQILLNGAPTLTEDAFVL